MGEEAVGMIRLTRPRDRIRYAWDPAVEMQVTTRDAAGEPLRFTATYVEALRARGWEGLEQIPVGGLAS